MDVNLKIRQLMDERGWSEYLHKHFSKEFHPIYYHIRKNLHWFWHYIVTILC